MNTDQSKGKWKQLKGEAKKAWGKLTGDNAEKAEGSKEELYGVIQEKIGDAKEMIKGKLDTLWVNSSQRNEAAEKQDGMGAKFSPTVNVQRRSICCG